MYNEEKNSDLGPALVKLLMESKQEVPDFLEAYKPEGEVEFHSDDTDAEGEGEDEMGNSNENGFGHSASTEPAQADQGWGGDDW